MRTHIKPYGVDTALHTVGMATRNFTTLDSSWVEEGGVLTKAARKVDPLYSRLSEVDAGDVRRERRRREALLTTCFYHGPYRAKHRVALVPPPPYAKPPQRDEKAAAQQIIREWELHVSSNSK